MTKRQGETALLLESISTSPYPSMREGDVFIDSNGEYYRIDSMEVKEMIDHDATERKWKSENKDRYYSFSCVAKDEYIYFNDVLIRYSREYGDDWSSCGSKYLSQMKENWTKVDDPDKYRQLALDIIEGRTPMPSLEEGENNIDTNTGLIHVASKERLLTIQKAAAEKSEHLQLIHNHVAKELNAQQNRLRGIMSHFNSLVSGLKKEVARISRIIYTIELYLGVNESILHFQEGEKASIDEPISFRQRIMFMDEEVGDPRLDVYGKDGGLDFNNIEAFDNWLCSNANYKKVIPEQKCVCVFKVRREKKHDRTDNPFISAMMDAEDMKTYILIRNGDNLYRIWVDMEISERLFPHKSEMMDLQRTIEQQGDNHEGREAKEKFETELEAYQRNFIMLQGLMDRTDILHPMKEKVQLSTLDLEKTDIVRFIYDDGPSLAHAGYVPFKEWIKSINATIEEGSRIIVTKQAELSVSRFDDRFVEKYDHKSGRELTHHLPGRPHGGLYTVYKKTDEKGLIRNPNGYGDRVHSLLYIKFNPQDDVLNFWDRWDRGHKRKNNISYAIMPEADDFLINFDAVTSKDVDFYLDSRMDRRNYLSMMPLLWNVREQKRKEEEEEAHFIQMLIAPHVMVHGEEKVTAMAKEQMQWWKLKNKWKRGLKADDAKAFRMIGAKLKKALN